MGNEKAEDKSKKYVLSFKSNEIADVQLCCSENIVSEEKCIYIYTTVTSVSTVMLD